MAKTGLEQSQLAAYCLAASRQAAFLCTNNVLTKSANDETCIAAVLKDAGNSAVHVAYHDNAQFYPEVAAAAIALGVNYALANSTITLKFKDLVGLDTVPLTETELTAIVAKNCNTFTKVGNSSRTLRNGVQSADTWCTDTKVNLDNFVEELQVAVYNVFLREPKVPYTTAGQMMLVAACQEICTKYTSNGTFADRKVTDTTAKDGYVIEPATKIEPMPINTATASDRAARIAPPIRITAYLAGAIHKVTINVNVVQ